MNSSYKKGRRNEYRSMRLLEAVGYLCIRSAGSHSPFDIVGVGRSNIALVQCKTDCGLTPAERETLRGISVPANVTKYVHRWNNPAKLPVVEEL